jgi:hypothetical protein
MVKRRELTPELSKQLCDQIKRDDYYRILKHKRQKGEHDYIEIKWNGLRRKWSMLLRHQLL